MQRKPYADLTTQGEHRHDRAQYESGMNVRAQNPPPLQDHSGETGPAAYQLLHHDTKGLYVVRAWRQGDTEVPGEGFQDLGSYEQADDFREILGRLPGPPRYVVFENRETGEVFFERDVELSDN